MISFFKEELEPHMSEKHFSILSSTPFSHLFRLPKIAMCQASIHRLVELWDETEDSFLLEGVKLKFTSKEVGVILGLPHKGLAVKHNKKESKIHVKHFSNKSSIKRAEIEDKLKELVRPDAGPPSEFVSVLVMYLFTMVLFAQSNGNVPVCMFQYVDSMEGLGRYAWAPAVHLLVKESVSATSRWVKGLPKGKSYFVGCSFALLIWFYEHVDLPDFRAMYDSIPRYLNWDLQKHHRRDSFLLNVLSKVKSSSIKQELSISRPEEIRILEEGFYEALPLKTRKTDIVRHNGASEIAELAMDMNCIMEEERERCKLDLEIREESTSGDTDIFSGREVDREAVACNAIVKFSAGFMG